MRVNVYAEELGTETLIVTKKAPSGREFIGVRFMLRSPQELHNTPADDDRSGVTFWVPGNSTYGFQYDRLRKLLQDGIALLDAHEGKR